MLHIVFALLLSDADTGPLTATALTPSQVFANAKAAIGKLRDGTFEVRSHGTGGGETVTTDEIADGDDYSVVTKNGPFEWRSGKSNGQSWWRNANGAVILNSDYRSTLQTPWALAMKHPEDPKSGVRVMGITVSPPQQIVVEIHPQGEQDQYRYYDAKTSLLTRIVTYTKTGTKETSDFMDYRTLFGETRPFHSHFSDGSPEDEWDAYVDSVEPAPQSHVANVAVPRPLFSLPDGKPAAVPVHFTRNGIVVTAAVNGKPVNFLLDSGASNLVIDSGFAASLGAKSYGHHGADIGGKVDRSQTMLDSVDIGDLHLRNVAFTELPFSQNDDGYQVSGLLGFDFIASSVVQIDFKAGTVTLLPRSSFDPDALHLNQVQAQLDDGIPRVQMSSEGVPGWFVLDTGSFVTMAYRQYVDKLPSAPMVQSDDDHFIAVGGENAAERRALSDVVFGGIKFGVVYAMMPKTAHFELYGYDGLLGRDVLAEYKIYFDYLDGSVYVTPNV
ncbi:MAG TPA: aspartyl protease family protein [Candidatus Baltobacteraceae bacterium]|jgi:hypothetical protein|nr:aspartyl protease family protein [Candidatus Baltobacteraceae bacterium]